MFIVLAGGAALGACDTTGAPLPSSSAPAGTPGNWNAVQLAHATTIVGVGKGLHVPPRGWVIALATAMQESRLQNYANDNDEYPEVKRLSMALPHDAVGHDHDSVGLFQQRPIEGDGGWGTVSELMTPTISATKFYRAMLKVPNWRAKRLGDVAQSVQRSLFPRAYDDDEQPAAELAAHLAGVPSIEDIGGGPPGAECGTPDDGSYIVSPGGWTSPLKANIVSAYGPRDGRLHAGIDLGYQGVRGKPIRAAAAGTVVIMKCNAPEWHGCDTDGSPNLGGCGWYVEIAHAGNIHTRYCHMIRQPLVKVGDVVPVGTLLGYVGSSGNSSGPHLHFEVHTNVPDGGMGNPENSTDPARFMATQGAPLGQR
jgi:murein DD-endopeptidase MepM/ murein hydrolase activator NlpD